MFRKYIVSIEVTNDAAVYLHDFEKELGCSISEPSNWLEYGSTNERGLTFLDKHGNELVSGVFMHQPVFNALNTKTVNETEEIKDFIFAALVERYPVTPADVRIKVAEFNRL